MDVVRTWKKEPALHSREKNRRKIIGSAEEVNGSCIIKTNKELYQIISNKHKLNEGSKLN